MSDRAKTAHKLAAFGLFVALSLGFGAGPSAAAPLCLPDQQLREQLAKKFAERPAAVAIDAKGALVQLYRKADGASWTIVTTRPGQMSCVVAAGKDWTDLPDLKDGQIVSQPDISAHDDQS